MNWKQLLAQRKVQLHTTSKQELDGLRATGLRSDRVVIASWITSKRADVNGPVKTFVSPGAK